MIIELLLIAFVMPEDYLLPISSNQFGDSRLAIQERRMLYLNPDLTLNEEGELLLDRTVIALNMEYVSSNRDTILQCIGKEPARANAPTDDFFGHRFEDIVRASPLDEVCLPFYDLCLPSPFSITENSIKTYHELLNPYAHPYDVTKVPITKLNLYFVNVNWALTALSLMKWLGLSWMGPDSTNEFFNYLRYLPPDPRLEYRANHPVIGRLMRKWLEAKGVPIENIDALIKTFYDLNLSKKVLHRLERHRKNSNISKGIEDIAQLRARLLFPEKIAN